MRASSHADRPAGPAASSTRARIPGVTRAVTVSLLRSPPGSLRRPIHKSIHIHGYGWKWPPVPHSLHQPFTTCGCLQPPPGPEPAARALRGAGRSIPTTASVTTSGGGGTGGTPPGTTSASRPRRISSASGTPHAATAAASPSPRYTLVRFPMYHTYHNRLPGSVVHTTITGTTHTTMWYPRNRTKRTQYKGKTPHTMTRASRPRKKRTYRASDHIRDIRARWPAGPPPRESARACPGVPLHTLAGPAAPRQRATHARMRAG